MAAATVSDIIRWFTVGREEGASRMFVVCDTFDYEDYAVYLFNPMYAQAAFESLHKPEKMSRVMECYDLTKPLDSQLAEGRSFHL